MENDLKKYEEKRDFEKTPEPRSTAVAGDLTVRAPGNTYVVHRHDASRLHFDLRLADGNRLVCWAVPKGFDYDPAAKHLAVHTEDHPLEYLGFEGLIPKGEYGAGSMNVWDTGGYELVNGPDLDAAVAGGEVKLRLKGRRLRGEWHLVRLKGKAGAPANDWLIIKGKDKFRDAKWNRLLELDLSRVGAAEPPASLAPMEPGGTAAPFDGYEWAFEPELEGKRAFLFKNGGDVRFMDGGRTIPESDRLIERFGCLSGLAVDKAVFDGALLSLDENGAPSRAVLDEVMRGEKSAANLYYYAFDLLFFEDYDVRGFPYRERRGLLDLVAAAANGNPCLSVVDYVKTEGIVFARTAKKAGFAAVIAKRLDGPYASGPADSWKRIETRDVANEETIPARPADPVKISNPDKVFFPGLGVTKRDLVEYYDRVSSYLLPYLRDRPLHLYRFPDGVGGNAFYQKHLPENVPSFLETIALEGKDESGGADTVYFICNNRESLWYLVNLGSIDLHPWFSRTERLANPDWIAWDLDPKRAPFASVVKLAREIGKLLRGIGLVPFLKTSGKSGLHVFVSVKPEYTYDQTRMFAESVSRIVANENREIASVERNVEKREDKVYIDFLQNRRGQTLVPPYVVRPVEAASVSTPLSWEELDGDLDPRSFTVLNTPERIEKKGDLFADILRHPEDLGMAVERLAKLYTGKGAAAGPPK